MTNILSNDTILHMKVLDENKYGEIWKRLDQLSPAAAFMVTIIHMGKVLADSGESEVFSGQNISIDEFETLFIINGHPSCRPKDVTTNSVMQPAKITRILDKLENKGFISRHPGKEDRRSYTVELTDSGKKCLEQAEKSFVESTQPMVKKMGKPAIRALNGVLRKILLELGDKS